MKDGGRGEKGFFIIKKARERNELHAQPGGNDDNPFAVLCIVSEFTSVFNLEGNI